MEGRLEGSKLEEARKTGEDAFRKFSLVDNAASIGQWGGDGEQRFVKYTGFGNSLAMGQGREEFLLGQLDIYPDRQKEEQVLLRGFGKRKDVFGFECSKFEELMEHSGHVEGEGGSTGLALRTEF